MTTTIDMQILQEDAYQALRRNARVLEADAFGDKVLKLDDGRFLKLFRRKRLLSSAAWYPYAKRFADNAAALARQGIPCPHVLAVYRIPGIGRDAVLYEPLPGVTLRQWMSSPHEVTEQQALKARFNRFIADLHKKGIYFRSLHLGNVVLTPDDAFGLIDIADMRLYRRALGKHLRVRNLRRMHGMAGESGWLEYEALCNGRIS